MIEKRLEEHPRLPVLQEGEHDPKRLDGTKLPEGYRFGSKAGRNNVHVYYIGNTPMSEVDEEIKSLCWTKIDRGTLGTPFVANCCGNCLGLMDNILYEFLFDTVEEEFYNPILEKDEVPSNIVVCSTCGMPASKSDGLDTSCFYCADEDWTMLGEFYTEEESLES